ncbi:unnamed protein product [Orchesella dallaii]|uniref:CUB domain-containing protein n=1 Tax=Orchesella dallaii TaxID=48710 RepID=A0ABP1RYE1_9HEXA
MLYKCPKCGRTLLKPSGWLASPNNKSQSLQFISGLRETCEWRIVATHGSTIILNITEFDLPFSNGCEHDYLEIRDGYWHKSPLLGGERCDFKEKQVDGEILWGIITRRSR